jgi:hypothetical protein
MSSAAAKYKASQATSVSTGRHNSNPCFRCLANVQKCGNLDHICTVKGQKAAANIISRCYGCSQNHNAQCMQVSGTGWCRMGQI